MEGGDGLIIRAHTHTHAVTRSVEKLKRRCDTLEKEIKDPAKFRDFYQFTFNFAKNPGQKGLVTPGRPPYKHSERLHGLSVH